MSLLDKATIITTPTAHSNGVLHSIKGGSVADFDVVRSSSATRVNAEGLIEDVAANIPRLDYTDGTASILLEPQSTNLILNSEPTSGEALSIGVSYESFDWGIGFNNCVRYPNNSTLYLHYGGNCLASTSYTLSYYMKMDNGGQPIYGTDFTHRIGNTSGTSPILTNMGNGVYRVSETKISSTSNLVRSGVIKGTSNSVNGFRTTALQLEALPYATSYIPTSGAIATRLADSVTGAGDASTFNSTEGVLYAEIAALSNDGTTRIISLSDGTDTNRIHLLYYSASNGIAVNYRVNGSTVVSFASTLTDINDFLKIAFKWQSGNFNCYVNGLSIGTNSNTTMLPLNTLNKLSFTRGDGSFPLQGKVKSVITFDTALTDAELECLTTI